MSLYHCKHGDKNGEAIVIHEDSPRYEVDLVDAQTCEYFEPEEN